MVVVSSTLPSCGGSPSRGAVVERCGTIRRLQRCGHVFTLSAYVLRYRTALRPTVTLRDHLETAAADTVAPTPSSSHPSPDSLQPSSHPRCPIGLVLAGISSLSHTALASSTNPHLLLRGTRCVVRHTVDLNNRNSDIYRLLLLDFSSSNSHLPARPVLPPLLTSALIGDTGGQLSVP